jgi:hypothetical protein
MKSRERFGFSPRARKSSSIALQAISVSVVAVRKRGWGDLGGVKR